MIGRGQGGGEAGRSLILRVLCAALIAVQVALGGVLWAQEAPAETPPAETPLIGPPAPGTAEAGAIDYADWDASALRAEAAAAEGRASEFALERLRGDLVTWRDRFLAAQAINGARIATVEGQIAALGALPAEGAPPEDPSVAARRAALEAQLAGLQAPILLAAEAYARANGLIGEIDTILRARQTLRMMQREMSPLNPSAWPDIAEAVTTRLTGLWKEVSTSLRSQARLATLAANWPMMLFWLALSAILLARGSRWMAALQARAHQSERRAAPVLGFLLSFGLILLPFVGISALSFGLMASGMFGFRATQLIEMLPAAALAVLLGRWLAAQFFGAARPLGPPFDFAPDHRAMGQRLTRAAGWTLAATAMAVAWLAAGDITAPVSAAILLPFEIVLASILWRMGRLLVRHEKAASAEAGEALDAALVRRKSLALTGRAITLIAIASPLLSLMGFLRASDALLYPATMTVALAGLLILVQRAGTDLWALVTRTEDRVRDGLAPVAIAFVLILVALPLVALIWGARASDLVEVWTRFREGFSVGETRLQPGDILTFALIFGLGYALTRVVQRTLRDTVLPKTRLDLGGQNAIVSGIGYLGVFLAALLAITSTGLDLSSLAIVAGALSVGIGFGLQNIVSNFVSGIILLIERPVSEGDWIEVGGRSGYVRDISVRSTRIETFDRTDVIVPNSDLISGQVVNYTRGNSVGRVIARVGVAYGTETARVEAILREIAEAHPMVLLTPPPGILFTGFGADSLNFEIRAIIRDVNFGGQVLSEMNHAIALRMAAEGIEIPFPQRDVWIRNPEALLSRRRRDETPPSPDPA